MTPEVAAQRKADRALCPVTVAQVLQLKVRQVAAAMRAAGVTEALTVAQAKAWMSGAQPCPVWLAGVRNAATARSDRRSARNARRDLEDEHRGLLLADDVEQRLLAGRPIRGYDREFFASDFAFRAMKDLVRANGDASLLGGLDLAALRWAGVDPQDRATWFLEAGGAR